MKARTFRKLPGDEGYQLIAQVVDATPDQQHDKGIELNFRQLRREHHQLHAELEVECDFAPQDQRIPRDGKLIISCSDLNLSSQSARTQRAKYCAERSKTRPQDGVDWIGIIDDACVRVIAAERVGEPVMSLNDVMISDDDDHYTIGGFELQRHDINTLVSDGGKGKSTLALYGLGTLVIQRGIRGLICDYETDGGFTKRTAQQFWDSVPPGLYYRRCSLPFVEEAEAIRRDVHRLGISFCVLDSIVPACGDPAEESATAAALLRAQRAMGCGWLNIAHVSKAAERGKEKPFGSQFFWNESRSVWVLESHASHNRLVLAVHHRKNNHGPLRSAAGFELQYHDNKIDVKSCDVMDTAELADGLPVQQRMQEVLRRGMLPIADVAERLNVKPETVSRTARRYTLLFTRQLGMDGVHRIGLVAREA